MRESDREAFGALIDRLFGAFPTVPITDKRRAAYVAGLAEMPVELLERCVDRAIGPKGEERIPSSTRLWEISRELRVRADSPGDPHRPNVQYLLACYVLRRYSISSAQLSRPKTFLYAGHPRLGASDFAITGLVIPAHEDAPEVRVMVADIDLDAVWAEEQDARALLERQRAEHLARQAELASHTHLALPELSR